MSADFKIHGMPSKEVAAWRKTPTSKVIWSMYVAVVFFVVLFFLVKHLQGDINIRTWDPCLKLKTCDVSDGGGLVIYVMLLGGLLLVPFGFIDRVFRKKWEDENKHIQVEQD